MSATAVQGADGEAMDADLQATDGTDRSSTGTDPPLDQDVAFQMLSCRRRRHALQYLRQHGGAVDLRTLSRHLAAWENDVDPAAVTYQQRVRVYTALRQAHLPKLDDCGLVSFDADRSTVELTERATKLEVYLDVVPHDDIAWGTYYAGLGGLWVGFAALTVIGVPPFSALAGGLGVFLLALLVLVSGLAHVRHDRTMRSGAEGPPPG